MLVKCSVCNAINKGKSIMAYQTFYRNNQYGVKEDWRCKKHLDRNEKIWNIRDYDKHGNKRPKEKT